MNHSSGGTKSKHQQKAFKRSTVWICTCCPYCLFFYFCNDNNPTGRFERFSTPHTETGSVHVLFCFFVHHVSAVFRILESLEFSCVSDCFLPTVKLNEASGWKLTGLRSMLHVPVGWTDTHKRVQCCQEKSNKISEKIITCLVSSVLNIHVLMSVSFHC